MAASRRDPSDASIGQASHTYKRNENRPARKGTDKKYKEEESSDSSADPLSTEETHKPMRIKPEPATDDEPLSTTDESDREPFSPQARESFDRPPKRRKSSKSSAKDVKSQLEQVDAADNRRRNDETPKSKPRGSPQTALKRTGRYGTRGRDAGEGPKRPKKTGDWKRGDDGHSCLFNNKGRRNPNAYSGGFQNLHGPGTGRSRTRVPTYSPSASDKPVHSSQATGSPTEFRNPLFFSVDDAPSSSFPTESSRANDYPLSDGALSPYASTSSPSSAPSVASDMLTAEQKERLQPAAPVTTQCPVCPVCGSELDEKVAKRVRSLEESTVQKQYEFCRGHRKDTAEKERIERGYPDVDWKGFKQRVGRYLSALEDIIHGKTPSFYRHLLESSSAGSNNIRLTAHGESLQSLSCGYYGSKGMNEMSDIIISHFKTKLRQLSNSDSLMRATSVSGYIGQVLVPELTIMLVKEDMGIDDEDAREVINRSKEIGELLNEVESDVVPKKRRKSFAA